MIYNSPYYGFATRADLFFALRAEASEPRRLQGIRRQCRYRYAAEHITSRDDGVSLMIGRIRPSSTAS